MAERRIRQVFCESDLVVSLMIQKFVKEAQIKELKAQLEFQAAMEHRGSLVSKKS